MDLIVLDFESFYGTEGYTLSAMTTEAYVRDPRFEAILCSFIVNDETPYWVPGPDIPRALADLNIPQRAVVCQHAHFDGLILKHHYGLAPRLWLDTLGMGRALHGANGGLSLAKLAMRYGLQAKGDEVLNARGMRLNDFLTQPVPEGLTPEQATVFINLHATQQFHRYGAYSCNDSAITKLLAQAMTPQFSREELEIHDQVIRMFTEPVFVMDTGMLDRYAKALAAEKALLMLKAGVQLTDLMSNEKFAECLRELGVEPPLKVSPTWLKKSDAERTALRAKGQTGITYAFAKSDAAMQQLQEHEDEHVQMLVEARLKNKTTIAEKGALRLIDMASRGPATVYLKYSGASGTHRLSGGEKFNWQSMKRGSDLRNATMAPPGYKVARADSSNIEARVLDWLSGQDDMVEVYRKADAKTGPDMYCVLAERIYKRPINKADDPQERQMGKVAVLGLGYGLGAAQFVLTARAQAKNNDGKPLVITLQFSKAVVDIYREAHPQVKKLWKRGEEALAMIAAGQEGVAVDFRGLVRTCKDGLVMPGGLRILYPDLRKVRSEHPGPFEFEWEFWNGRTRERVYGAKVIANVIQCLARIIVFGQCMQTVRETRGIAKWAHSMHDEGVFVQHAFHAPWVLERLIANFRTAPEWASSLPLNCEAGIHERYGKAKT